MRTVSPRWPRRRTRSRPDMFWPKSITRAPDGGVKILTGLKVSITRTAGLTLAVRLSSEVSATCTEAHDASSNDGVSHPFWRRFRSIVSPS